MENTIEQLLAQSILETEEMLEDCVIDGVEPVMYNTHNGLVDSIIK